MSVKDRSEGTIVAVSTATGPGGIGMVRMSGPDSIGILGRIFRHPRGLSAKGWKTFTARYGVVVRPDGSPVDEVLVTLMRAPKSYTCEDVVEISCHGGAAVVQTILELCLKEGARLAQPGEFTKRAFLNGRIDLTQAEAVLDMINAKTEASLRASERQLRGELHGAIEDLREQIMGVFTGIEAVLNFPEDDTDAGQVQALKGTLFGVVEKLTALLGTSRAGRILKEGVRVVICGKTNVGKSSLLNALLRHPRAIVTDLPGTTRDILEESANIKGVPVSLVDTAGILEPRDRVEEEAVRRTRIFVDAADVALLVLDRSRTLETADYELLLHLKDRPLILVLNKADLPSALDRAVIEEVAGEARVLEVSDVTRAGLVPLEEAIVALALGGKALVTEGLLLNNLRHVGSMTQAVRMLQGALTAIDEGTPLAMVSEQMKAAVRELDAVTGRNIDEDLVDRIFSDFCIGK